MGPEVLDSLLPSPDEPIVGASLTAARVEIRWRTTSLTIPAIWLRDNCQCSTCHVDSIEEHRYFVGYAEQLPSAITVACTAGAVDIAWSDGHRSHFDTGTLTRLRRRATPRDRPLTLWRHGFTPPRFDYEAVTRNLETRVELLRTLGECGAVVVTDAPTVPGTCADFIASIGAPVRETPFDRVHDVTITSHGYNIAHTSEPLPPHTDFASYQWPPSGQVLHMLVNEASGGESTIVDGWQVAEQLRTHRRDYFDTLCRVVLTFREHAERAESWAMAPIIQLDVDASIRQLRFSNQLMQPLGPDHPEIEAFYDAYHALSRMLVDATNQVSFRLETGQMLLVHSHRVLHGRRAFEAGNGARHLQDTYFEFDDIWAEAERLGGQW